MSIRKVVAGLLITAGIAIMAVPFFWRATGEKQTEQLISEFEQTLEDNYDEETDVEEEQTSISKEDEAILKEGGVIGIIEIPSIDIRYPVMEGTGADVLNAGIAIYLRQQESEKVETVCCAVIMAADMEHFSHH